MSNSEDVSQKIPPVMECGAAIDSGKMEEFVHNFQKSAKRWEFVVYPAMFAFTLLASYGFFLIYSLTSDMTQMATSMDPKMAEHMEIMSQNMLLMSRNMTVLTKQVTDMSTTMHELSNKLDVMPEFLTHMKGLDKSVAEMNKSVVLMTDNTHEMRVMPELLTHIKGLDESVTEMNESIILMTNNTHKMQLDIMFLGQSISNMMRPMSILPAMMW